MNWRKSRSGWVASHPYSSWPVNSVSSFMLPIHRMCCWSRIINEFIQNSNCFSKSYLLTVFPIHLIEISESTKFNETNPSINTLKHHLQYLTKSNINSSIFATARNSAKNGQKASVWKFENLFYPPEEFDYGCWCGRVMKGTSGKGPTLDEYDWFCKELFHCFQCAQLDIEIEHGSDENCDPWTQDFLFSGNAFDFKTSTDNCKKYNSKQGVRSRCDIQRKWQVAGHTADTFRHLNVTLEVTSRCDIRIHGFT